MDDGQEHTVEVKNTDAPTLHNRMGGGLSKILSSGLRHPSKSVQAAFFTLTLSLAVQVKFEGEGVDDYGGPYREIFSQVLALSLVPFPQNQTS
jgi:hypothetical protein